MGNRHNNVSVREAPLFSGRRSLRFHSQKKACWSLVRGTAAGAIRNRLGFRARSGDIAAALWHNTAGAGL